MLLTLTLKVLQFLISLAIGVFALYTGFKLFDRLTKGIEEWEELKRGNVAVGIYVASIFLTLAFAIKGSIADLYSAFEARELSTAVTLFAFSAIDAVVALLGAIISIYIALRIIDRATPTIDEWEELKRGNVAVALLMATVIFSLGFIISDFAGSITQILSPFSIAGLYG